MAKAEPKARGEGPEARRLVLGTAGHIDHGKSTLVRALTGVDPDRLPEEQKRGITIELGFAPLRLSDEVLLGVVDVPGHEKLVRTMVAGASGIDLLLLVVAADEGVMPQTREHLAIARLLGLRHGVVALTKTDRVDEDVTELAVEEVREILGGTSLEDAPVVPVSATEGRGLDALRDALLALVPRVLEAAPLGGPARLPVDRSFAMRGFGSVVTGTLAGSPLSVGDTVEVLPEAKRARVRGLQRFGESLERALPGMRCAVNLQGLERDEIQRGCVLCAPGRLPSSERLDVRVQWLDGAPPFGPDPVAVELLVGTAERRARLAPIGTGRIAPGESAFARLHVDGPPVAVLPGDRFVVRGFAALPGGGATLGGGEIVDVAPPHRRRSDPVLLEELDELAKGDVQRGLVLRVTRAGFGGVSSASLALETGLEAKDVDERLRAEPLVVGTGSGWIGAEAAADLEGRLLAALDAYHRDEPLKPGIPRRTLLGMLPDNTGAETFEALLSRLEARGALLLEAQIVRAPDHVPRLTQRQEAQAAHLRADAMASGLEPKTQRDLAAELQIEESELAELLAHLERDGSLTRAGDLFFDRVVVDELRESLITHLREHGSIGTQAYKDLIGTSRKYAVPLMELFDSEHLTVRRGDERVLRRG